MAYFNNNIEGMKGEKQKVLSGKWKVDYPEFFLLSFAEKPVSSLATLLLAVCRAKAVR